MTRSSWFRLAPLALAALVWAGPAVADTVHGQILGNEGTFYQLRQLSYGEVYEGAPETVAGDPLLAVQIHRGGEEPELLVVPETEGPDLEETAFLAYDGKSDTLYLTWERRHNYIHSQIQLVSLRDGEWSDVIRVSDRRFSFKSSPQVTITRESYVPAGSDPLAEIPEIQQTIVHTVWLEDRDGRSEVVYAPIVLIDGVYSGHHERIDLSTLFSVETPGLPDPALANLTPVIRSLDRGHAVAAGFIHPDSGRLVTLRLKVLGGGFSSIGEILRSHILDVGARYDLDLPADVQRIADDLRSHILDVGARMNPEFTNHLAGSLRSHILDVGARHSTRAPEDVQFLADELRSHILDVGFRLERPGTRPQQDHRSVRIEQSVSLDDQLDPAILRFEEGLVINLPDDAGQEQEQALKVALHLSNEGHRAALSWQQDQALRYRETLTDGWSEVHSLPLTVDLQVERAEKVLVDHLDDDL